ncbi:MAG: hypothetical protein NT013_15655 [Planctomycetia bacterium]|nr:hypothetical protein [Planctomycetia bacterium]
MPRTLTVDANPLLSALLGSVARPFEIEMGMSKVSASPVSSSQPRSLGALFAAEPPPKVEAI